jgi:GT2 family glycosyltransferase
VRVHKDIVPSLQSCAERRVLLGGRLLDWNTGWNEFDGKLFPYIEGWILATSKRAWEEFGYGFDELFIPNDMEDLDLSTTARALGYSLEILPDGHVSHIGAQTIGYGETRENITNVNKEKFRKKWIG